MKGVCACSVVSDSETVWSAVHQAPLSVGFSRQGFWSGVPCLPPEALPNPGLNWVSCGSCVGKRMLYHRATWEAPSEGSRRQNKPEPPVVINVMDWNVTGWGAWKDELLWGRVIVSLCKSGQDRLCEKVIFEWTPGNSKRESCVKCLGRVYTEGEQAQKILEGEHTSHGTRGGQWTQVRRM